MEEIRTIVQNTDEDELSRRLSVMQDYVADVSWNHQNTRIVENILGEAAKFDQGCERTCSYRRSDPY